MRTHAAPAGSTQRTSLPIEIAMQPLPILHRSAKRRLPPNTATAVLLAMATLGAIPASAQTVYRNVGPDGRVTFSDRQPNQTPAPASATPAPAPAAPTPADASSNLPYALRQTASRFPVVLYATHECSPCESARQLLQSRGIPYAELTVQTDSDLTALRKISGQDSLPFATIGKQHLVGFSSSEWTQYLNAAGYPASSQLPAQYQRPAAQPLTAPKPAEPAAPPAAANEQRSAPAQSRPQPAPARSSDNPAGLTF